ncbi:MAG: CBS domain-containing protein, partial [Planctomycetota bacterium]
TDLRRIYLEDVIEDFVIVRDFMVDKVITTTLEENLDEVLRRMTQYNINAIPIVDENDGGVLLGLLERNDFGRAYDRRLRALKTQDS